MARRSVDDTVGDILEQLPPGRLLEIPAGDQPIAARARAHGHEAVGADLFPKSPEVVQADACGPLPFEDGEFDILVSMEGIEHFENQAAFIRECARVLAPGGLMLLTTPNVLHLSSRLSIFLTGQRTMKRGFINEDETLRARDADRIYHGHAFLVDVFRLRYLMALEGLCELEVHHCRLSEGSTVLAPLIPLIWAANRLALRSGRRTRGREGLVTARPEVSDDLRRLAGSPALLLSRKLVVTARKTGERAQSRTLKSPARSR